MSATVPAAICFGSSRLMRRAVRSGPRRGGRWTGMYEGRGARAFHDLRPGIAAVLLVAALGTWNGASHAAGPALGCDANPAVRIERSDARMRMEAHGVALAEALAAVAGCVGADLEIRGSIPEQIEGIFEAPDLRRLIERMLERGSYSSVLVGDAGRNPPRVSRILVLTAQGGPVERALVIRSAEPGPPAASAPATPPDPTTVDQLKLRQVALAVRRKDERAAADLIRMLLEDDDPAVREIAAGGLAEFSDPALAEPIAQAVEQDEVPAVRYQAIRALGAVGGPFANRVLLDLLVGDTDPLARRMAVRALGRADGPGAREALALAARQDSAPEVRDAARLALGELRRADQAAAPGD